MQDITLFGRKVSPVAAGAIGAGSIVVIWFAWKQHKAGAGTATSASAIDPLTGLPASQDNQPDPVTGEAYLAEAQQYGSVQAAEQALSGTGLGSFYQGSPYGYGTGGGASLVPQNTVQGTTYASDAAWSQAVQAGLTDIGYDPIAVGDALGQYLNNLPETPAQAAIVRTAIAEYGPPPAGSHQVILAPSPPAPPPAATAPGPVQGFSVTAYKSYANFGWHAATNADNYELKITGPQDIDRQTGNVLNQEHVQLHPGKYSAVIRANNHGKLGPWSAAKTFIVK